MLGQDLPVKAGDVFIAKPEETHEIISSRTKPLAIYFWAFTLVRQPDHEASDIDRSVDLLLDALARSTQHVAKGNSDTLERTLHLLNDEIVRKPPGYTQSIRGLTIKLLLNSAERLLKACRVRKWKPRFAAPRRPWCELPHDICATIFPARSKCAMSLRKCI